MKFSNTLSRKIEQFSPADKEQVRLYTCGPTVYNNVHIGNLRAYIFADILKRALEFNGYDVNWVVNITDVDDKTIANTIKNYGPGAGVSELKKLTDEYYHGFLADLAKINIEKKDISFVKVTDKIAEIQLFILKLIEKGFAYKAEDGSTYFSIEKYQQQFGDYGALVGEKFLEGKKVGARVNVDEYDKENLSDFALWKAHGADDGKIFWDHPMLGPGRPGWHIECTVINYAKFPSGTDIHTGGVDLIFPHHSNEIAQAQPVYRPFVRYWLHSEHIIVDGKKMSKSLGNFYTLADLERENIADGNDLRFLMLQSHYQSRFNITRQSLEAARAGLRNIREQLGQLITDSGSYDSPDSKQLEKFKSALDDNLNTPEALAIFFETLKSNLSAEKKLSTIFKMDEVLGLNLENNYVSADQASSVDPDTQKLLKQRQQAKEQKNFDLADKLREQIEANGYELRDTNQGPVLKRKA